MNKLLNKRRLAENVIEYVFDAKDVVRNAKAGQFVILRVDKDGERVPFTICDYDKEKGTLTLLVQTVGYTTAKLAKLEVGDTIHDLVGPLGNPTDLSHAKRVLLVGGGIGTAVIYPQSKQLKELNKRVDVILGARDKSLLMYEEEFAKNCENVYIMTDNGSKGEKGFVTDKLKQLVESGEKYDVVFAVGPLVMMKAVSDVTREYGIETVVSMNSIMVDGTGMCGGCRVSVGGETKYSCVDGPEFDGHKVDFDEAIARSTFYKDQEEEQFCKIRG
ncbi:MAG: sulfide/dihydroorotate dehydrogenase-like FAD/NAD-binding protein [Bacillota bacterium]